jgi:hypothetical protein
VTVEDATATIERSWGLDAIRTVLGILDASLGTIRVAAFHDSLTAQLNTLRELHGVLVRALPVERRMLSLMATLEASSAHIEEHAAELARFGEYSWGGGPAPVCPTGGEVRRIVRCLRLRHAATCRLRDTLALFAQKVVVEGDADAYRRVAAALEAYSAKPTERARAALRAATRMRAHVDHLEVALVLRAQKAVPALRDATEVDWAYFAIAVGIDSPCKDRETFRAERRAHWRAILRRARRSARR